MQEKKQVQNVSFQTVRELLAFLPPDQLEIVEVLRELVFSTIDGVEERLSFNVPFYRLHKGICFIWPGAVSWGSKTGEGVELGFIYGNLLTDEANYLDRGNRKQVYSKRFSSPADIKLELLTAYLLEAVELDELMFLEKMSMSKKKKK